MRDPVTLPSSGVTLDRATIARHLQSDATDPFSRAPLKMEELRPEAALKARIAAWVAAARLRSSSAAAAAAAAAASVEAEAGAQAPPPGDDVMCE
jgi:ubiquitin conjugation factor E4 B